MGCDVEPRFGVVSVRQAILSEGALVGGGAVEVSFSDCNMWDGHPLHRGDTSCSQWCDASFAEGDVMTLAQLVKAVHEVRGEGDVWALLTGGEPLLQVTDDLLQALRAIGLGVIVETNCTLPIEHDIDWLIASPKVGTGPEMRDQVVASADELKVVLPGVVHGSNLAGWSDGEVLAMGEALPSSCLFVQPQDVLLPEGGTVLTAAESELDMEDIDVMLAVMAFKVHLKQCLDWVHAHAYWRLSLQTSKLIELGV